MTNKNNVPAYHKLMNPTIKALHELGGSGTVKEIENKVVELEKIPDDIADLPHGNGSGTEIGYRLAWARTYLKKYGVLENSRIGVWAFASSKNNIEKVNPKVVIDYARGLQKQKHKSDNLDADQSTELDDEKWRDELMSQLMDLSPDDFEKLAQRILRESGFDQVAVTGRSGDGGIDGHGVFKIADIISLKIQFQCKRWNGAIPVKEIRDFGGALRGRDAKGLFITTSTFTKAAVEEASREGAEIDLMDGSALIDKIKALGLGVKTNLVEQVEIDHEWFKEI
ncbi:MAG: restriction endonuclease [Candidatus Nomurabacteria bacterium]|jgi:restriction system protein|nr:restriction endonuclease [Candidatus Nomurabacteria bacterium]